MLNLTYNKLQRMIQRYTKRDDIYDIARDFIRAAEIKIAKEVKTKGFEDFISSAMTIGDRWLDQPPLLEGVNSFDVIVSGRRKPLIYKRMDFIQSYWPDPTLTGEPKYYTKIADTKFIVAPTPALAYPFELYIYVQLTPLSESNQTNWLTDKAPMLLVYAVLIECAGLMDNDPRLATWEKFYARDIKSVSQQNFLQSTDRASQQGLGPPVANDYDAATIAALLGDS